MPYVYLLDNQNMYYFVSIGNDDCFDVVMSVYADNPDRWSEDLINILNKKFLKQPCVNNRYDSRYHAGIVSTFCTYVSRNLSAQDLDSY